MVGPSAARGQQVDGACMSICRRLSAAPAPPSPYPLPVSFVAPWLPAGPLFPLPPRPLPYPLSHAAFKHFQARSIVAPL